MSEKNVQSVFQSINHSFLSDWRPSLKTKESIIKQITLIANQRNLVDRQDLVFLTKEYLKQCFMKSIRQNPNSNLKEVFFTPYRRFYDEVNQQYHFEDNECNYLLFVSSVIDTLFLGINKNFIYRLEKEIKNTYFKNRKIYEKQTHQESPKKENPYYYYEFAFKKDKNLLNKMIEYLDEEDKNTFFHAKYMNNEFVNVLQKINNGIKVYFLVTSLSYSKEEQDQILKNAMEKSKNFKILSDLQEEFAKTLSMTRKEMIQIINNNESLSKNKNITVFLGMDVYNLEYNALDNARNLAQVAIKELKKNLSKKGLFRVFNEFQEEDIYDLLNQMKNEKPKYYEIMQKKHGENFKNENSIDAKELITYQKAKNYLEQKIKKLLLERKKMLKSMINNSKENIHFIKERRRNKTIEELSFEYHVKPEKICDLFAKNILLFGKMIPEVIRELKLYNYPLENQKAYLYYQKMTLKKE